jgi:peptidoglycan/LPS O-acetylase OafA/YrhL
MKELIEIVVVLLVTVIVAMWLIMIFEKPYNDEEN